jgi:hypothetical protein
MSEILERLAASAARVHLFAREGLGLSPDACVSMADLKGWRGVADYFLAEDDGDFKVADLRDGAAVHYALAAGLPSDDPVFDEATLLAWEAVARHLCQWVNELVEGDLRGLEASEEQWLAWAQARRPQTIGA